MRSTSTSSSTSARLLCAMALAFSALAPAVAEVKTSDSFAALSVSAPEFSNLPDRVQPTVVVPEPGTYALIALGLLVIGIWSLRRRP